MDANDLRQAAVVGSGLMGHAIALEFALAGVPVRMQDVDDQRLAQARAAMDADLAIMRDAGLVDQRGASSALELVTSYRDLREAVDGADLVVEAVYENLAVKRQVFGDLGRCTGDDTILASNTSSFAPSALAAGTHRPERILVAHHFNPPHLVPLVEVVPSSHTDPEVVATTCEIFRRVGRYPVVLRRELAGFVANRLQAALLREALAIVEQGAATADDVDAIVRYGFGRRLSVAGPFEVFDLAGLDIVLAIAQEVFPTLASSQEPPASLRARVARGDLGVKTGRGVHAWPAEAAQELRARIARALVQIAAWK